MNSGVFLYMSLNSWNVEIHLAICSSYTAVIKMSLATLLESTSDENVVQTSEPTHNVN